MMGVSSDSNCEREQRREQAQRSASHGADRRFLAPFYSHTGRPSVDPELMVPLIGYSFGIRS